MELRKFCIMKNKKKHLFVLKFNKPIIGAFKFAFVKGKYLYTYMHYAVYTIYHWVHSNTGIVFIYNNAIVSIFGPFFYIFTRFPSAIVCQRPPR